MNLPNTDEVIRIAKEAGEAILDVYDGHIHVEFKDDESPLTVADRVSHDIIDSGLRDLTPGVPIVSEEGADIPYGERKLWTHFWLVDPLDGTKEFIKRNGEFTVNIALVRGEAPVLGVILVPAKSLLYYTRGESGAFRSAAAGPEERIHVRRPSPEKGSVVVQSRSHPSPELDEYLKTIRVAETVPAGSSLKFCTVAEGNADLYPRFGPTMEWDTAAGQAILEAAGGTVLTPDGRPLTYNKPDLRNGAFIASGESV